MFIIFKFDCQKLIQLSQLELLNTPTTSLLRGKSPTPDRNESLGYDTKPFWGWGSCPGALGNVEYHIIAITSSSTLTRCGSIR